MRNGRAILADCWNVAQEWLLILIVISQGLKPLAYLAFFGPAKAVPLLQSWFLNRAYESCDDGARRNLEGRIF
jgi:hypothetical protein